MKKNFLLSSFTVTVVLLLFCFSASANFEERPYSEKDYKIVNNIVYTLSDDGKSYCVTDYFATQEAALAATEVNIPAEIDGIPVTEIKVWDSSADNAHIIESLPNIKKVTIPDSIIKIGNGAFACFDSLDTVELSENVEHIGDAAFYKMDNLKSVVIPTKVTKIGEFAFSSCKNLETVEIKGKITEISYGAFSDCKKLVNIEIPDSVKKIGANAFKNTALVSVTLPGDVILGDSDAARAFSNCKKLTKVVFTDCKAKSLYIPNGTFQGCTSLKRVYLPKSVKRINIGYAAFFKCKNLTKIYNTKNVYKVDSSAFSGCKNLKSFIFGTKIEIIGSLAFKDCINLKSATFNNKKVIPEIEKKAFAKTKNVKFIVKNKKTADALKTKLTQSGLKTGNFKIRVKAS